MSLFLSSFALAIAFCAPPGVVTAETVRRGFDRGFWPALLVQVGSLIGDSVWAILALFGAATLIQNWIVRLTLALLGIGFLGYLAIKAIKDSRVNFVHETTAGSGKGDLITGALLSLSNPFAIAFWFSVSTSIFSSLHGAPNRSDYAIFFSAFYLGLILWCLFIACIVTWGRRFVTSTFYRWINLLCGIALGFFAFELGWKLIQNLG
jgi:threonine/homoserine/homoserine lactone efflux protein